jgi:hypothetical protein
MLMRMLAFVSRPANAMLVTLRVYYTTAGALTASVPDLHQRLPAAAKLAGSHQRAWSSSARRDHRGGSHQAGRVAPVWRVIHDPAFPVHALYGPALVLVCFGSLARGPQSQWSRTCPALECKVEVSDWLR